MVAVYVSLIQKGLRTLEQVPVLWRTDVEKIVGEQTPE